MTCSFGRADHPEQISGKYYKKYQQNNIGIEAVVLPSTSPANAAFSLERLIDTWQKLIVEACGRGQI